MRFRKFLSVMVLLISTCGLGWAQSQPETGTPEQDISKSVHIFPNPATEFVHIKLESSTINSIQLTLHNIIGNPMDVETEIVGDNEIRVRVKDLASGYYLLAIRDEASNFRGTYKFLKR